jgi:hypothetical protein
MNPLYRRVPGFKPMFESSTTPPAPTVDWLSLMAHGFIVDVVQDAPVSHEPEAPRA